MSDKLTKINDLAFELQHDDELTAEQYWKVKQIFELSVQYQLNPNQQIVLEYLQKMWKERPLIGCFPFSLVGSLHQQFNDVWDTLGRDQFRKSSPHPVADGTLSVEKQFQVMEAFGKWAQEQEDQQ